MVDLQRALDQVRAGHWEQAHNIVQVDESSMGAWLHGILHLQEGDLDNARYWYGRARRSFPEPVTLLDELARFEAELRAQVP